MNKTFWHLTTNRYWKLDPTFHPISAYGLPEPTHNPGLFVTDHPNYWNPWMGVGPIYAVHLEIPEEDLPKASEMHPEYFITNFQNVKVKEVISLEEALQRSQEEQRQGIPWTHQIYGSFGSVADWWFSCREVWNDEKMQTIQKCRTRKGLSKLMDEWRAAHPGYKNPDQYYRKKYK